MRIREDEREIKSFRNNMLFRVQGQTGLNFEITQSKGENNQTQRSFIRWRTIFSLLILFFMYRYITQSFINYPGCLRNLAKQRLKNHWDLYLCFPTRLFDYGKGDCYRYGCSVDHVREPLCMNIPYFRGKAHLIKRFSLLGLQNNIVLSSCF